MTNNIDINKHTFFPVYIFESVLAGVENENKNLINRIYNEKFEDPCGIDRSNATNTDAWHSRTDVQRWNESQFLVDIILNYSRAIFDELNYSGKYLPELMNMWANVSPQHGFNKGHIHPLSLWSGVYYLQTADGCGDIIFTDPRIGRLMFPPEHNDFGDTDRSEMNEITFKASRYKLLLFPSYLQHEVEPNISNRDRISISFNIGQYMRNDDSRG